MAINFLIPTVIQKNNERTLAKGFGLPLVKRAFLNANREATGDKSDGTSILGTPLYGTFFIEQPNYNEFLYDETDKTYTEKSIVLPDNKTIGNKRGVYIEGAIVEISQPRNVVLTKIAGMDGSVKEYINNGDYSITIKGYFAGETPETYPQADVTALNLYLKAPVALKVTNVFLNSYFGVTDVVVTNFSFFQEEGVRNIQYFQIECLSDTPFEILENKV